MEYLKGNETVPRKIVSNKIIKKFSSWNKTHRIEIRWENIIRPKKGDQLCLILQMKKN